MMQEFVVRLHTKEPVDRDAVLRVLVGSQKFSEHVEAVEVATAPPGMSAMFAAAEPETAVRTAVLKVLHEQPEVCG